MTLIEQNRIFAFVSASVQLRAKQIPDLIYWNIEQHTEVLVNHMREAASDRVKDGFVVRVGRQDDGRTKFNLQIGHTDPLFWVMLTGSATKNIENPGPTYEIHPIHGKVLALLGNLNEHGHVRSTPLSIYRRDGKRGPKFSVTPPGRSTKSGFESVEDTDNPGGEGFQQVTQDVWDSLTGMKKGASNILKSFGKSAGGNNVQFVAFIRAHPGRGPDPKLRAAFENLPQFGEKAPRGSLPSKIATQIKRRSRRTMAARGPEEGTFDGIPIYGGGFVDATADIPQFNRATGRREGTITGMPKITVGRARIRTQGDGFVPF